MRNGKGESLDNRRSSKKIGEGQRPHPPKTEGGAPGAVTGFASAPPALECLPIGVPLDHLGARLVGDVECNEEPNTRSYP